MTPTQRAKSIPEDTNSVAIKNFWGRRWFAPEIKNLSLRVKLTWVPVAALPSSNCVTWDTKRVHLSLRRAHESPGRPVKRRSRAEGWGGAWDCASPISSQLALMLGLKAH